MRITKPLVVSLFISILWSSLAEANQLSVEEVHQDIDLARDVYERVHPGYLRYSSKKTMDQAWEAIKSKASKNLGMSVSELTLEIQSALTLIRCDHTKTELPKSLAKQRRAQPVYLPFSWTIIGQRGFIDNTHGVAGINDKDEIVAIDGQPLEQIISNTLKYIPYDGNTSWGRIGELTSSMEFLGSAVDHFGALADEWKPVAEISLIGPKGNTRTVKMNRISRTEWLKRHKRSDFNQAVSHQLINSKTGYLRVDSFVNYRTPAKPETVFKPIFKAFAKNNIETLILDLRRNGGGSTDAQYGLLKHLLRSKLSPVKEMQVKTLNLDGIRDHLWTWDKRALNPSPVGFSKNEDGSYALRGFLSEDITTLKPSRHAFKGQLIVLVGHQNSSGSTSVAALLKEHRDAILIGNKTGGSPQGPTAGLLFTLTLPNSQIRARVPFFRYINNVSIFPAGLGITPDEVVPLTVDDFLNNKDAVLEKALSLSELK